MIAMTEVEWLECADPSPMLEFLGSKASDRKLRLFLYACCQRALVNAYWDELECAVEAILLRLEDRASAKALRAAKEAIEWGLSEMCESLNLRTEALQLAFEERSIDVLEVKAAAQRLLQGWEMNVPDLNLVLERKVQSNWLRDIFGNPFRPVSISPGWRTPAVASLAHAAYENRVLPSGTLDNERLAVLADALEDVGASRAILDHLQSEGPHVRGCFALDLILDKR